MTLLEHPEEFKAGTRVMLLVSRNKDGATKAKKVGAVSHNAEEFDQNMEKFMSQAVEGQRVYATAYRCDVPKGARLFKERQLASEYSDDPMRFYRGVDRMWASCLMKSVKREDALWMFDCDTLGEYVAVVNALRDKNLTVRYDYPSKSGWHVVTSPFNTHNLPKEVEALLMKRPLMLWAY